MTDRKADIRSICKGQLKNKIAIWKIRKGVKAVVVHMNFEEVYDILEKIR